MHHLTAQITGVNKMYNVLMTAHMCMVYCSESHKARLGREEEEEEEGRCTGSPPGTRSFVGVGCVPQSFNVACRVYVYKYY